MDTFFEAFGFSANFLISGRPDDGRQRAGDKEVEATRVTMAHAKSWRLFICKIRKKWSYAWFKFNV